ncbi:hypothetical protein Tco_0904069 [Tanacetum coccineum]
MHVHEPIVEKAEHVAEEDDHDMGTEFGIVTMGDARLEDMYVDDEESPFDTKSEIKVVKRMHLPNTDDEDQITFSGPVNMDTDLIVDKLEEYVPDLVAEALKATLPDLLSDSLKSAIPQIINCSRTKELVDMIRDMVHLLNSASVFCKANTEGEKWEKANPDPRYHDPTQGEQQPNCDEDANFKKMAFIQELTNLNKLPPITEQSFHHYINCCTSSPTPLNSILPQNMTMKQFIDNLFKTTSSEFSPTPPRDENKGKGVTTEENPLKELIPLTEQGGSDPEMINLQQFSISSKKMILDYAKAQLTEMKRLVDLKAEQ